MTRRRPRGMTVLEVLFAMALSLVVLGAAVTLLLNALTFYRTIDEDLAPHRTLLTVERRLLVDVGEANLGLGQVLEQGERATPREVGALAVPCARDLTSERFVTAGDSGLPVWQTLRVYYVKTGDPRLWLVQVRPRDLRRLNPAPAPLPKPIMSTDELRAVVEGSEAKFARVSPPRVVASGVEWFGVHINAESNVSSLGVPTNRYWLQLGVRVSQAGRHRCTMKRAMFSENSMYQEPGPSQAPLPIPPPPVTPPSLEEEDSPQ